MVIELRPSVNHRTVRDPLEIQAFLGSITTWPRSLRRIAGNQGKATMTVERIIAAAGDAIAERGIHRVTMREVASRARLAVGNVTYYFETKEHLLEAVIESIGYEYVVELSRIFDAPAAVHLDEVVRYLIAAAHGKQRALLFNLWVMVHYERRLRILLDRIYNSETRILCFACKSAFGNLSDARARRMAFLIQAHIEGVLVLGDPARFNRASLARLVREIIAGARSAVLVKPVRPRRRS